MLEGRASRRAERNTRVVEGCGVKGELGYRGEGNERQSAAVSNRSATLLYLIVVIFPSKKKMRATAGSMWLECVK